MVAGGGGEERRDSEVAEGERHDFQVARRYIIVHPLEGNSCVSPKLILTLRRSLRETPGPQKRRPIGSRFTAVPQSGPPHHRPSTRTSMSIAMQSRVAPLPPTTHKTETFQHRVALTVNLPLSGPPSGAASPDNVAPSHGAHKTRGQICRQISRLRTRSKSVMVLRLIHT